MSLPADAQCTMYPTPVIAATAIALGKCATVHSLKTTVVKCFKESLADLRQLVSELRERLDKDSAEASIQHALQCMYMGEAYVNCVLTEKLVEHFCDRGVLDGDRDYEAWRDGCFWMEDYTEWHDHSLYERSINQSKFTKMSSDKVYNDGTEVYPNSDIKNFAKALRGCYGDNAIRCRLTMKWFEEAAVCESLLCNAMCENYNLGGNLTSEFAIECVHVASAYVTRQLLSFYALSYYKCDACKSG